MNAAPAPVDLAAVLARGDIWRGDALASLPEASIPSGHAALDAVDDFKLALDVGGDGLAGEERFAPLRIVRDPVEFFFHIGPNPNRHGGAGGHGIASDRVESCTP